MGYGNMEHALYRTGTVRGRTALLCAALGGCAFPGEQDFSLRNRRPASQPASAAGITEGACTLCTL